LQNYPYDQHSHIFSEEKEKEEFMFYFSCGIPREKQKANCANPNNDE
jgi:hypothetical protein